jgi:YggT family protein
MNGLMTAAVDRYDIANYVSALFTVYIILIFVRVLLSWIPRLPRNAVLSRAVGFVHETTDPYLNLFRRVIPPIGGGGFAIDLSPIVAIIVLVIAQIVVVSVIQSA